MTVICPRYVMLLMVVVPILGVVAIVGNVVVSRYCGQRQEALNALYQV